MIRKRSQGRPPSEPTSELPAAVRFLLRQNHEQYGDLSGRGRKIKKKKKSGDSSVTKDEILRQLARMDDQALMDVAEEPVQNFRHDTAGRMLKDRMKRHVAGVPVDQLSLLTDRVLGWIPKDSLNARLNNSSSEDLAFIADRARSAVLKKQADSILAQREAGTQERNRRKEQARIRREYGDLSVGDLRKILANRTGDSAMASAVLIEKIRHQLQRMTTAQLEQLSQSPSPEWPEHLVNEVLGGRNKDLPCGTEPSSDWWREQE